MFLKLEVLRVPKVLRVVGVPEILEETQCIL